MCLVNNLMVYHISSLSYKFFLRQNDRHPEELQRLVFWIATVVNSLAMTPPFFIIHYSLFIIHYSSAQLLQEERE